MIGAVSSVLSGVPTSEGSGIFPEGVAMRTHALERFGGVF